MSRTHNIEEVKDHSVGLLVTGVTRIVEKVYVITCIRLGWYELFPQLVISFSLTSLDFARSRDQPKRNWDHLAKICQRGWASSHDVTAAILVFQTNPVRVVSSYVKKFSCSRKFAWMLATWENTLYTKNVKFERDLWTTNEEYMQSRLILQTFVWLGQICAPTTQTFEKFHFASF